MPFEVIETTSPAFTWLRKNGLYGTRTREAGCIARDEIQKLKMSSTAKNAAMRQLKRKRGRGLLGRRRRRGVVGSAGRACSSGAQRPRSRKPRATTSLRRSRFSAEVAADFPARAAVSHRLVDQLAPLGRRRDPARLRDQPLPLGRLREDDRGLDRLAALGLVARPTPLMIGPNMPATLSGDSAVRDGVEPGHRRARTARSRRTSRARGGGGNARAGRSRRTRRRRSARSRARRASRSGRPTTGSTGWPATRSARGRGRPGRRSRRRCRRPRAGCRRAGPRRCRS